jgi:Carboxypeptidase regulatory-like domain/TonB-dependent Receptor Plug Domain
MQIRIQAQDITKGSIVGVVRDASGSTVPGATVNLNSPFGDHTTTTNAAGEYSFLNIVIGPGYKVTVEKSGFASSTADNLTVGMNQQTIHDFSLAVGSTATTVEVTEVANAIDLSTTQIGANIDDNLFKNVPVGRNIASVMAMAPGVADSDGAGASNPSINGASGLENEYIIDGANTTDPGFGGFGTYSRVYGSLGNGINFDFIQEVQVQTGGFEAQYGQALGGIINVVTKSGTNQFHGDIFGYFQPQQFEATRTNANPLLVNKFDYVVHQASTDYGADAGGRLIKDKLFWYGGFNPLTNSTYKQADPFFANYALGVIDRPLHTYDYTGKIDYNINDKHQLEGSVFGDPSSSPMTFNSPISTVPAPGPVDTSVESKFSYGTRTWTARYNGTFTPTWAVTINYSNYYNSFTNTPLLNGYQITDNTAVQAGTGGSITYGGIGFNEASVSKVNQMAASSTHIFRFLGGHSVTYGYQFEDDVYNDIYKYTGAPFALPNVAALGPAAGQTVSGAAFTRQYEGTPGASPIVLVFTRGNYSPPNVATDTRYNSGYIQDSWTFGRITIKPGIRFEEQSLIGVNNHYDLTHNWAPRIGFVVDPFNNRKTKIYATWGRFFEKVPLDIAVRSLSDETSITGALYADPGPGAQPNLSPSNYIPGGNIAFQGGAANLESVAAGTGAQYQDEVAGGVEHEFSHNLTVTGRFVYRDLRRIIEDMSGVNVTQALAGVPQIYVIGNPSKSLDIFQNVSPCTSGPNCNTGTGFTNFANGTNNPNGSDGIPDGFPNPYRIYKSAEFIVSKRISNIQFYGSYVLSKLYGNFQGSYRSDNGQNDPNISSMFDFTNSDGRLTGQDIPGLLETDRTHQFKLFANYTWKGFTIGASWTPTSGTPITDLLDHPAYLNAGEIPVCPNSSGAQPLSTTLTASSFTCAGGPRGALGRTAWIFPFNLHGEYALKLKGERMRVKFVADMFNLFNEQAVVRVNQFGEQGGSPGTANPDFLKPALGPFADPYQNPFNARLAVRFEF